MREKHNSSYLSKINESNAKTTSNIVLLELFPHLDYDDKLLSCADERVYYTRTYNAVCWSSRSKQMVSKNCMVLQGTVSSENYCCPSLLLLSFFCIVYMAFYSARNMKSFQVFIALMTYTCITR